MNPATDCPICFEEYTGHGDREQHTAPCCGQCLCLCCSNCLQRCPFCRTAWHGASAGTHWQRRGFPNPISLTAAICLQSPGLAWGASKLAWNAGSSAVTGARAVAASASIYAAEASPVVIGGTAVGIAALLAGGAALYAASRHQEVQSGRLQAAIRNRRQNQLCQYHDAAAKLFGVVQWHLSPQKKGMPHVYHGSVWRSAARERHFEQVQQLCVEPRTRLALTHSDRIWSDLSFCVSLWLEYNPHTANWGTSPSYGPPPFGFCWHNRWREDMRHAISDLARQILSEQSFQPDSLDAQEKRSACCLLAALDHTLSWQVATPRFGHSDLVEASWYSYRDFCEKLLQQFALAWALAGAPEGEVDLSEHGAIIGVDSHMDVMASREIPDGFCFIW